MTFQEILAQRLSSVKSPFGVDTSLATAPKTSFFREYQTEILAVGCIGVVGLMFAARPSASKRRT